MGHEQTISTATATTTWGRGRGGWPADRLDTVVLDASCRQSLVAIRQLGRAGLNVGAVECRPDMPAPAFSSRWCSAHAVLTSDRRDYDDYVDEVLELLPRSKSAVLVAAHDGSIEAIRHRRAGIEQRHVVALAPDAALARAIDKTATLSAAREVGIRVPRSVVVTSPDQIGGAVDEVGLPIVVKSTQEWIVGPETSLLRSPRGANTESGARSLLESYLAMGATVLAQEYIPGAREAVSFVYTEGGFHGEFAQVAERTLPIVGGSSILRTSIPLPPDAAATARRLVEHLGLVGYSEVEFRRDAGGHPVLMEINPRLSASVEVAVRSGVDFPVLLFRWATQEPVRTDPGYRIGVRMRWLGGDVRWLRSTLAEQGGLGVTPTPDAVRSFADDFLRPTSFDLVDRQDLRPALRAAAASTAQFGRRVRRRIAPDRSREAR